MSLKVKSCGGCGCDCGDCNDHSGFRLHLEIENLKQKLLEKENHILSMETNFLREAEKFPNGEMAAISEELLTWQDKYSRLFEAHKRVQKVNQNLEDKLLRIVDKCETEKNALTTEVSNLTRRLVDEKFNVARLQEENERYRNDVNLAIQLLQCKPSNFVSQKYDSLPGEMQQKVRMYISNKRRQSDGNGNLPSKAEIKTIKVPIPTYPPTAMVYSVNKGTLEKDAEEKPNSQPVDIVSAAIMAKILEEREKERALTKHCDTCTCSRHKSTKYTQTHYDPNFLERNSSSFKPASTKTCNNITGPLLVRNRDKDRATQVEITIERVPTVEHPNHYSDPTWENEADINKPSKSPSPNRVAEGILVNIDSTENLSVNSGTSESSSQSWQKVSNVPSTVYSSKPDYCESDLILFDKPVVKPIEQETRFAGPRHCSVRVQVGSNNILLDNVVDPFTPILYKSKNSDALVHGVRSRSGSSNSSGDEPILNSKQKSAFRTETEI